MNAHVVDDQRYLRAALLNQYNVILLCGSAAFAVALASVMPVLVGLLGEALWLWVGPRSRSFRDSVDARGHGPAAASGRGALPPEQARRVAGVEAVAAEIEALCAGRADVTREERQEVSRRLRASLQAFVTVCAAQQRLRRLAADAPLGALHAEVASLHRALESETDLGIRASYRRAMNLAERRLRQQQSQEEVARSLDLAIARWERALVALKEGAAGLSSGAELCSAAGAASAEISSAATMDTAREAELALPRMSTPPPALT